MKPKLRLETRSEIVEIGFANAILFANLETKLKRTRLVATFAT